MTSLDKRLSRIEARLDLIELQLGLSNTRPDLEAAIDQTEPEPPLPAPAPAPTPATFMQAVHRHATPPDISITRILGWTGATALVLATAYLIRLAVDSGWLTPQRQVVAAVIGGLLLIGGGLRLRSADREYASLLPAGGLVVLFLSIYGAHLYYQFIGVGLATGAVILTCLAALWLGRLFESEIYSLFAVVGSYSAPFLLEALAGSVVDLVIYFSAWSVLFCIFAIWLGTRRIYLLAAYMALLGFHVMYDLNDLSAWAAAFSFQTIQFLVFVAGAVWFSIRAKQPMNREEAIVHLPLLLIFYALQYPLLQDTLPLLAPWLALASAALLLGAHVIAKNRLATRPQAGSLLVSAYTAMVLFHAGYMELVPPDAAPWLALLLLPALAAYQRILGKSHTDIALPFQALVGIVFAINYLRVVTASDSDPAVLGLFYAAELYAAYHFTRRLPGLLTLAAPALYAGHISLMGAAVNILDDYLAVSIAWGFIALACLALAFQRQDKLLGKSSLLIFAASAAKVLLFDLSGASPLVRIASLAILGMTLYAGGWMYRKLDLIAAKTG